MKVSVIIPLFNAEKYFAVCLESLAIQTMTDFEVIVVDDCSTDSSLAIAESYLERFGGRLKIITLPQNTGNPAIPRNVGLDFARGEYVYFVDADDFLMATALETLCNVADKYRADVVYMETGFICGGKPIPQDMKEIAWGSSEFISSVPTFESDDISERIDKIFRQAVAMSIWTKFLRRDFLICNNIKFPNMTTAEDVVWTFKILCAAKRILRVQTSLYVYRTNDESLTKKVRSPEQTIIFWLKSLVKGTALLDEFMSSMEFFKQNPFYRLKVINFFANIQFDYMEDSLKRLPPEKVYEIFLLEFSKEGNVSPALIAYSLAMNGLYRNELV